MVMPYTTNNAYSYFPVPTSVHGHECCTFNLCLPMVYSIIRKKVYFTLTLDKVYTDTTKKARTVQKIKELSSHSYSSCSRHLGCVLPPLLSISLDNIVLHLLLRIMDVLIRNMILYADGEDHRQK